MNKRHKAIEKAKRAKEAIYGSGKKDTVEGGHMLGKRKVDNELSTRSDRKSASKEQKGIPKFLRK